LVEHSLGKGEVISSILIIGSRRLQLGGWREEKVKYGFAALVCLAWWLPNLLIGETGASEVEQFVLIAGFPVIALYLAYLLVGERIDRRNLREWKARADSEKMTVGFKGRE
jgi:hypothetical protein